MARKNMIGMGGEALCVSSAVSFNEGEKTLTILHPEANMQTDDACFEAVALLLKSMDPKLELTLRFSPVNWDGSFHRLPARQQHYMRFLYRADRFRRENSWFHVEGGEKEQVDLFAALLWGCSPINNVPNSKASSHPKGTEHRYEKLLAESGREYLSEKTGRNLTVLDHQMPNGLFCNSTVCGENRIFPTGFFDIWGLTDQNELCLFELKIKENRKMGMLSELYFYAEYAAEFLLRAGINRSGTGARSYDKLQEAALNGCRKIQAYFLVEDDPHPKIKEHEGAILNLLNGMEPRIEYHFLRYRIMAQGERLTLV